MPTPFRRQLRRARRGLGYAIAIALVLVALLLGVASQLLPLAERNPERIAAWLSERAGRPVAFDRVDTEWTRRGPLLQLANLRIGEGAQAFTIGDAEMLLSVYAGLLPGHSFSELRLRGLELTLERTDDGRWQVRGLPGQQQTDGDALEALEGLGELQVIDGKLAVIAPSLGIDAHIPKVDLRLRVSGERVRAGVRAWPRLQATPLDAVLDLDRTTGDGRAYAGANRADLAAWSSLLRLAGIQVGAGQGRAEAWAELRNHRLAVITIDTALDRVALRSTAAPSTGTELRQVHFDRVEGRARWRLVEGGWRLDAPMLRIGNAQQVQTLDGLVIAGGAHYALLAERLDATPLLAVASLSDRVSPALQHWLQTTRPTATLQHIEVYGRRDGAMHARARIDALGFAAVGDAPGVQGLAGEFNGDAEGFSLQLDPAAKLRFDWPRGFGAARTFQLSGQVTGWREGAGWRVGTPALRIAGDGIGVDTRGSLLWQGDGTRPRVDLAATVDRFALPVAKTFWIRHRMPERVQQWLDTALVGGTLQDGRALLSGDLDDWPFRDQDGSFQASGRLRQAVVKFHPEWPAVEAVDADVRFVADGFEVEGSGRLGNIAITSLQAGIDQYQDGRLLVQASGAADASALLAVLRQSPLRKTQAETLDNLSASGPAEADFEMTLPLRPGSVTRFAGTVGLNNAVLADARWKLAFDHVNGLAEYSRSGFRAERLDVRHQGQPGRLSLRAGDDYVRERGHGFEAALEAPLDADALIDRAPELGWLKPHLDGRSPWTMGLTIPKSVAGRKTPAQLQLRSSLVGTALDLPEPLRKPAREALATTIETSLPVGEGDIRIALGQRMALRARNGNGRTGVRIALGASRVDEAPPASGLVATGTAARLDAMEWIALARSGGSGDGEGLKLQRIDVTAQRLTLLGGVFGDTRLVVAPAADGATAVRATGAALQGALLIPAAGTATIAGRFERVHWRSAKPPAVAGASSPAQATTPVARPAADGIDPAKIPPLTFDIDDLRVGDARLGSAKFRSRPTPAGLRIEQLQARRDDQSIDVTGDWSGRDRAQRTRMIARIESGNIGALLSGFGFANRVGGGQGNVRFDAAWPGSPAAFALESLDGSLTLEARDGRLLEVEPGAGRVLGLLSIAELPRRLTLDFRDFFSKGFAFNRIAGSVRFANGTARSDDLLIDGPAAAIGIRGSANLRAESFDQTIEVRPKAGNLLAAVGAIAGGPVGAALGVAANAVLQKPLGQIAAKTYRVTGPWKEPKVEVITREQGRASQRALAPVPPAG
ncbi:MAG: TIGR02099 family protein [Pseudomonadota bacterium]|nr:TIGR02099 family protein [Pseudomonadota bacterium]